MSSSERSRSRKDRPVSGGAGACAVTNQTTLPHGARELSRVGRAITNEADASSTSMSSGLPPLQEKMRCRDRNCRNDTFRIFILDPMRPEDAQLECVECGTYSSTNAHSRLLYLMVDAMAASAERDEGSRQIAESSEKEE